MRSLAVRLIALRVLKDMVAQADSDTRRALTASMMPGDRTSARLEDGTAVGAVTYAVGSEGKRTVHVHDDAALTEWVREHRPDEVVTTSNVRRSYLTHLLDTVRTAGTYVDTTTGETFDLPGVTVTEGESGAPSLRVLPAKDAADRIRAAWVSGELSLTDLTAVEQ